MRILYGFDRPARAPLNWDWVDQNCSAELIERLRNIDPNAIPISYLLENADDKRFFAVLEQAIIVDRITNESTFYQFADDFRSEDQHRYLARLDRLKLSSRSNMAPRWYPPFPPVYGELLLHIYYREEHERLNKFLRFVSNSNSEALIARLSEIQNAGGSEEIPLEYVDACFVILQIFDVDTDPQKFDRHIRRILRKNIASKYLTDPNKERYIDLSAELANFDTYDLLGVDRN